MTYAELTATLKKVALDFSRGLLTAAELTKEAIEYVTRWEHSPPEAATRCGATVDVRDGPYSEPIPWLLCDLPPGHQGSCDQLVVDAS